MRVQIIFNDGEVREYDFPTADEVENEYEEMKRLTGINPDDWDLSEP